MVYLVPFREEYLPLGKLGIKKSLTFQGLFIPLAKARDLWCFKAFLIIKLMFYADRFF
ncbi:MAG: hypothetical protein PHW01_00575 [Patescibacteria group bacterium]|nr:hypothetical protein [Patescibacteria group bacterium]